MSIGIIHQSFRSQKNRSSSDAMPNRPTKLRMNCIALFPSRIPYSRLLRDQTMAEDQDIHAASTKRPKRLLWCIHNRLPLEIERRI
jgi:hypothetical protein